jgi:hypothetical protein
MAKMTFRKKNKVQKRGLFTIRFMIAVFMILILTITPLLNAELASQQEMDNVCRNWLTYKVYQISAWAGSDNPQITQSFDLISGDMAVAKVYNISPDGFVIVPIIKELPPVKAYSETGRIDADDNGGIAQLLKDVLVIKLETHERVFGELDAVPEGEGESGFWLGYHIRWDTFSQSADDFNSYLLNKNRAPLEQGGPLVTSMWHQHEPYKNYCPNGDGGRCVVGCVATALAQIMNFWQWPDSGVGEHTYYWNGDSPIPGRYLSADFSDPYDWDNMPDSCVLFPPEEVCWPEDSAALAELSYEVGVSMEMRYHYDGTSAVGQLALVSLPLYFRYSHDLSWENRINHDLNGWYSLIKSEIDLNRPMYYQIHSHAIVCDGYRDDGGQYEYHMNYGWSGTSAVHTAWYVIDSLYCYWIYPDEICPPEYDILINNIYPQQETLVEVCGHHLNDSEYGNGDGHMEPGERAKLWVTAENIGQDWPTVFGSLYEEDPYINLIDLYSDYGFMQTWDKKDNQVPFEFSVDLACPDPYIATVYMTFNGDFDDKKPFYIHIGDTKGFADNLENDEGFWVHKPTWPSLEEEWHLDSFRFHTSAPSWKFGGNGPDPMGKYKHGDLITPPILLPPNARLIFWHWMDASLNVSGTAAREGGIVSISTDGCEWTQIEPIGGYPHYSDIWNQNLFADSTPCYSGSFDWKKAEFDLFGYSGVVQLMFRFSSARYGYTRQYEGWYIDDITVDQGLFTSPAPNEINVPKTTDIQVHFGLDMDGASFNSSNFKIYSQHYGMCSGTIAYDDPTQTVTFTPAQDFDEGELITVQLMPDIQISEGDPYGLSYIWSFTMESEPAECAFEPEVTYGAGDSPGAICAADFDNDGDNDLAVLNWLVPSDVVNLRIFINDGVGGFSLEEEYILPSWPNDLTANDFDDDGNIDLAVACRLGNSYVVLLGNGDGTFTEGFNSAFNENPHFICSGDFDRDGDIDFAATDPLMGIIFIHRNDGSCDFMDDMLSVWGVSCLGITSGDIDLDGDLDLITSSADNENLTVLRNDGSGIFTLDSIYDVIGAASQVLAVDLNGDRNLDLVAPISVSDNAICVFFGNESGIFTGPVYHDVENESESICAADLDGDGDLDLAVPHYGSDQISYLINPGDGNFDPFFSESLIGEGPNDICAADFNGDGRLDLALANKETANISIKINTEPAFTAGDANGDQTINVSDAVYVINYVFAGGDPPDPYEAGDSNCDTIVNVSDAVWVINYVFVGGPEPGDC